MQHSTTSNTIATGLAMFSMFFGAGNVIFPLALGLYANDLSFYAVLGLLITGIGVPFTGLISMTLYNGDYKVFFARIGKIPGFVVSLGIMALIGPFGALPRCIALSYSTAELYLPHFSIISFSIVSCIIIFLFTFRRNNIIEILGYVLTPLLVLSLAIIIIFGFITSPSAPPSHHKPMSVFLQGLKEGYQTMDLLGAFFFSSVVLVGLRQQVDNLTKQNSKSLIKLALKASFVGAFLLALIYTGFIYLASYNSKALEGAPTDGLINAISVLILGTNAGLFVCVSVVLACLSTAIALAAVFAEFIHEDITNFRFGYVSSLVLTLCITAFMATLNFTGIVAFLAPILQAIYPSLIVLSLANIFYKLYNFQPVKSLFFLTLALTIVSFFI